MYQVRSRGVGSRKGGARSSSAKVRRVYKGSWMPFEGPPRLQCITNPRATLYLVGHTMPGIPSYGKGVVDPINPCRAVTYARAVVSESGVFGLLPYGDMTPTLGEFVWKRLFTHFASIFHNATIHYVAKVDPQEVRR